jgi:hypothetical protein
MTGEWPKYGIDHINHNRSDNRWGNLRDVPASENMKNLEHNGNTNRPFRGVVKHPLCNKWMVSISNNGYPKYIGLYETKEEAAAARKNAERELGFHENHGAAMRSDI